LSDHRIYNSKGGSKPISRKMSIASGIQQYNDSDDSGEVSSNDSGFDDLFEIEKKRLH
jgi:hypothetical protein